MRILEVTNFFSPVHGGSAEAPYHLSKELTKRGHAVVVYTSDYKLSQEYINCLPGVKICAFGTWLSLAKFYISPAIISQARKEVEDFDVIHLHNYRTFQNVAIHYYAMKYGIPYVLQAHGSLPRLVSRQALKQVFDSLWGYRLLKDASRLIAVATTETVQYKAEGATEDKITLVPHGIDLAEFANLPEKGGFRKKHNLSDSEKVALWLGRMDRTKGLDLLLGAFAEISTSLNNIRLVLVGPDDGYLSSLKKLIVDLDIIDKILFTGPLYGQEKLSAYVDADLFVLPSSYEIFGITVLEALACGTPVIITDRCGIAEAVSKGQAGLVVPYDKEQLQNALLQMLSDDKMRQKFGGKGKLLVREKFSREKMAEQMEKVYQEIIEENKK